MRLRFVAAIAALLLSGCATGSTPIPEGYTGARAIVRDSAITRNSSKAEFFVLLKIDGKRIDESLTRTRIAFSGAGLYFRPLIDERELAARPMTVTIKGETYYGAPILELFGKVNHVEGDVRFTPQPGERYVVKGTLGARYSAVWIENSTGAIVTTKVEKHGS